MISGAPKLRITLHGIAVTRNSGSRRRRRCGYVIFATMKRAACRFGPNETNSMKGASERHKNLFTLPGRGRRAGRKEGKKEGRKDDDFSLVLFFSFFPLLLSLNIYSYFFKGLWRGVVSCLAEGKSTNADGTDE